MFWTSGNIGLGCRYQSTGGREEPPIVVYNGSAIVAEASIFDRDELARHLSKDPAQFDVQLLLQAYSELGLDFVQRVVGDFCFAIWDQTQQNLVLARDIAGNCPLFYTIRSRRVIWAMTILGILGSGVLRATPSESAIHAYVTDTHLEEERTFFEDIYRVPRANVCIISPRRIKLVRYWHPQYRPVAELRNPFAAAEAVRCCLERVVSSQINGGGPLGIALSGGLDSTTVSCLAARELARLDSPLLAFAAVPEFTRVSDPPIDESPNVRVLEKSQPNLLVEYVRAEGLTPIDGLGGQLEVFGQPVRNVINLYWLEAVFARAREFGVNVLLTGSSGNQTFSWHAPGLIEEMVRKGQIVAAVRAVWRRCQLKRRPFVPAVRSQILSPMFPDWAYWLYRRMLRRVPQTDCFAAAPPPPLSRRLTPDQHRRRAFERFDVGEAWYALGLRHRMRVRDPTGDRRLIEQCLSIPAEVFSLDGDDRWLARRATLGILPDPIRLDYSTARQAGDAFERMRGQWEKLRSALVACQRFEILLRMVDLRSAIDRTYQMESQGGTLQALNNVLQIAGLGELISQATELKSRILPLPGLHPCCLHHRSR